MFLHRKFYISLYFSSDINECNTVLNQCAFRCANIPGSFRCVCPMGYKVAADEIHCEGKHLFRDGNYFLKLKNSCIY